VCKTWSATGDVYEQSGPHPGPVTSYAVCVQGGRDIALRCPRRVQRRNSFECQPRLCRKEGRPFFLAFGAGDSRRWLRGFYQETSRLRRCGGNSYGNLTMVNILSSAVSPERVHALDFEAGELWQGGRAGAWQRVGDHIRFMALRSEHAPHFHRRKPFQGEVVSPLPRLPRTPSRLLSKQVAASAPGSKHAGSPHAYKRTARTTTFPQRRKPPQR